MAVSKKDRQRLAAEEEARRSAGKTTTTEQPAAQQGQPDDKMPAGNGGDNDLEALTQAVAAKAAERQEKPPAANGKGHTAEIPAPRAEQVKVENVQPDKTETEETDVQMVQVVQQHENLISAMASTIQDLQAEVGGLRKDNAEMAGHLKMLRDFQSRTLEVLRVHAKAEIHSLFGELASEEVEAYKELVESYKGLQIKIAQLEQGHAEAGLGLEAAKIVVEHRETVEGLPQLVSQMKALVERNERAERAIRKTVAEVTGKEPPPSSGGILD